MARMTGGALNFMRPPGAPRLGWGLLAAGVLALLAALEVSSRWDAQAREVERLARSRGDAQRVKAIPPPPVEANVAERRWRQIQVDVQRPWLPMLRAVEAATMNQVYLLALSAAPETGEVKLQAEAPDFDHAVAYLLRLAETGALEPGTLVSHEELAAPAAAGAVIRFSATTRWRAR